ncbi:MAG: hypothetical protein JXB88_24295 [Spirochaetales bacterium]|nr:hypothetical protein [Spirochaetales bacterium]
MNETTHTVITRCLAMAVCTKNRNPDNNEYRKGAVEPYKKIQEIQMKIENEKREPSVMEIKKALEMLQSIFDTKKVPLEEQEQRFKEIGLKDFKRIDSQEGYV